MNNWIISYQPKGWYWGETPKATSPAAGLIIPETARGPFPTAADAALDMVRTWAMASAAQPRSN